MATPARCDVPGLADERGLRRLPGDEEATIVEQMAFAIERSNDE
jgi:hypothetical protein